MAKRTTTRRRSVSPSALLLSQLKALRLTEGMETEYRPVPGRKFRSDYAWPQEWLLVEVDGGLWLPKGGHSGGTGGERDREKDALALMEGFVTLRVTPKQIASGQAVRWIQQRLEGAHGRPSRRP